MRGFEVTASHSSQTRMPHAVNLLIEDFRSNPANVWFVWWDLNVEITPEQMQTLIATNRPVIGCLNTNCEPKAEWMANFYPDVLPTEGILPLPENGGAVQVIHRTVFDLIEKADPDLAYCFDASGRSCVAFCQESLGVFGEYRRLLSPAYHFDLLCRKNNIGVFAHADVVLKYRGPDGALYPRKEIYRPWLFKKLPPPVIAGDLPPAPHDPRPIAVCLQYCDKDEALAKMRLSLPGITFVYSAGDKYPSGPNALAVALMRNEYTGCKAVLLLEPDCAFTTPDWLCKLGADWDRANAAGKLVMGSWHPVNADHPTMGHLNGNLMFHPEISSMIDIPDVPDDKPWDTFLADIFQPHWCRTGLIKNLNRHKTATRKQIETPECGTKPPVLVHGVKDSSVWDYAANLCATSHSSQVTPKISSG